MALRDAAITSLGASAAVAVSNSTVTANGTGLSNTGGALLSRVNNTVIGNSSSSSGTISTLPPM